MRLAGIILLLVVVFGAILVGLGGMHGGLGSSPIVKMRISSFTCLKNETGAAVVLNTTAPAEFNITKVIAVTSHGSDNNVTVYRLYKDRKEKVNLPYEISLKPGEELALGFLAHRGDVYSFKIITDGNRSVVLNVYCSTISLNTTTTSSSSK